MTSLKDGIDWESLPLLEEPPAEAEALLVLPGTEQGARIPASRFGSKGPSTSLPEPSPGEAGTTDTQGATIAKLFGWSIRRLRNFADAYVTGRYMTAKIEALTGDGRLDYGALKNRPTDFAQRVLIDEVASAETQNTIILDRHEAYTTLPVPHDSSTADATFVDYTAPEYLGPRYSRPRIGTATTNSQRQTVTVDTGVWVYSIPDGSTWTVELGADLATKSWVQRGIDDLVPGDGNYAGRYPNDDVAKGHVSKKGDFYYETDRAEIRVADTYTPGVTDYSFDRLRLLNAQDLHELNNRLTALTDRVAEVEYSRELGDQFDPRPVSTPAEYAAALAAHIADPDSDVSNRVLWLSVRAAISGSYQAQGDSEARPYSWAAGDQLVAPPTRDGVTRLFNAGQGGGDQLQIQSVTVGTIASYLATLASQAGSDEGLVLVISANIADSTSTPPFTWAAGDVIFFPPMATGADAEFWFNVGGDAADVSAFVQRLTTAEAAINANETAITANEAKIAANAAARWPGHASVRPTEVAHDTGAFTMRATLDRVSGTFPAGARMRISAYARTGAFVPAVANDDNTPAELAYTAEQAAEVLLQARHHTLTAMLQVYDDDQATTLLAELPVYITVRQASAGGQRSFGNAAGNISPWAEGNSGALLPDAKTPQTVVDFMIRATESFQQVAQTIRAALRLESHEIGTAQEYEARLRAQTAGTVPIIIHITAAISGRYGGVDYAHAAGSLFWIPPEDDTLIHIVTIPQGPGGGVVVLYDPDNPLVASADTRGVLVYKPLDGIVERTKVDPLQVRDMASSDLAGGRVLGGVLETGPIPEDGQYYFYRGARIPASNINPDTWVRWPINGAPTTINIAADLVAGRTWRGVQADLEAIAAHATAVGQIYAHGAMLSVVEQVQEYEWVDLVGVGEELILRPISTQTDTSGVDSLAFPAGFADYDEYEIIVSTNTNTSDVIRGTTAWLALQTDTDDPLKIAALDADEAGSRQWLAWNVATRTWSFGTQGGTAPRNLKIQSARLYNYAGKRGVKGDKGDKGDSGVKDPHVLQAAVAAANDAGVRAATLPANFSQWRRLRYSLWSNNVIFSGSTPTSVLSAQTQSRQIYSVDSNSDGVIHSVTLAFDPSTRVAEILGSDNRKRIIEARLED